MITVPGILVRQSIPHIRSNSRRALVTPSTLTPSRPHTGSHIQTAVTSGVLLPLSTITTSPRSIPASPSHGCDISMPPSNSQPPSLCWWQQRFQGCPMPSLTHPNISAGPVLLPANPGQNLGGYLGVSTAIKTYRRYNNNDGDNNSTFLCYEHRWLIVLVGIRP